MKKITQVSMLFIALFFMNVTSNAQSGDFELIWENDGDTEGAIPWGSSNLTVANGVLTVGFVGAVAATSNNGINIEGTAMSSKNFYLNKDTHRYIAVQLSAAAPRVDCFVNVGWHREALNPRNHVPDASFNDNFVYYYDFQEEWDGNKLFFAAGNIPVTRIIVRIVGDAGDSVDIEWIKTFADLTEMEVYRAANALSTNDVVNASQTKIISGDKKIDIKKLELNAKVEVFDLLGKSLFTSVAQSDELSININTTGIYIVKIVGASSVVSKKVIVK